MIGPPGAGKIMLAQRLPGIRPLLSFEEALETSTVFSVASLLHNQPLMALRPFRSPHHTISDAGLFGGGHIPRPGEVSPAHNEILFLDEFPEFRHNILDRIDLRIEIPAVRYKDLQSTQPVESSATIRDRVIHARKLQLERFAQESIYSGSLILDHSRC